MVRRLADADAQTRELLIAQLADDRAHPIVRARTALLAHAQLAKGQIEVVVNNEQIVEWRTLAREPLAHRRARLVHVSHGLDEDQVEAVVRPRVVAAASRALAWPDR